MPVDSDWHIHSVHSCDEAALPMADIAPAAAAFGLTAYGVSDHLHTPINLPDLYASRAAWEASRPPSTFHFGVEVSVVSAWELNELAARGWPAEAVYGLRAGGPENAAPALALTEEQIHALQIEYVIGGVHWPLYLPFARDALIRDYHRQNLFLATHPLVHIIAHPWWWHGPGRNAAGIYDGLPWFDNFRVIPASMHEEFIAACRQHHKVIEVNLAAMLLNPAYPLAFRQQYVEYLAALHAAGLPLALGSDCHDPTYHPDFASALALLDSVGLASISWWRLPPRPSFV